MASASRISASRSRSGSRRIGSSSATPTSASIPIRCIRQRSGVAGRQQSRCRSAARSGKRQLEPRRPVGQHPRLSRAQQPDFRHADLRPPELVHQRPSSSYDPFGGSYAFSLIGTSGTVLAAPAKPRRRATTVVQISAELQWLPRRRDRPGRRLGTGQRRPGGLPVRHRWRYRGLLGRRDLRLRQGRREARSVGHQDSAADARHPHCDAR